MFVWMLAIGISVAALIITAAARPGNVTMAYAHLAITACICIFMALDGIRRLSTLSAEGASRQAVAAEGIRATGMIWIWAGLVIIVTYATGIVVWKEWLSHFVGMFAGGGICIALATILANAANSGPEDETLMTVARILLLVQFLSMLALIVGFALDGQIKRFLVERFTDWPAKNVMFFGALAIAALSGTTLTLLSRNK
jgi:hypothetical protein